MIILAQLPGKDWHSCINTEPAATIRDRFVHNSKLDLRGDSMRGVRGRGGQ
jgi:hypothetical protein